MFSWSIESLPVCPFSILNAQFICLHRSHAEQELKRAANRFVLLIYIYIYIYGRTCYFLLGRRKKWWRVVGIEDGRWILSLPLDRIFVCVFATKECDSFLPAVTFSEPNWNFRQKETPVFFFLFSFLASSEVILFRLIILLMLSGSDQCKPDPMMKWVFLFLLGGL